MRAFNEIVNILFEGRETADYLRNPEEKLNCRCVGSGELMENLNNDIEKHDNKYDAEVTIVRVESSVLLQFQSNLSTVDTEDQHYQ